MAMGENKGDRCSIVERPLRLQTTQQLQQISDSEINKVHSGAMGEKDILFGRG